MAYIMQLLLDSVLKENNKYALNFSISVHRIKTSTLQFFCEMKRSVS